MGIVILMCPHGLCYAPWTCYNANCYINVITLTQDVLSQDMLYSCARMTLLYYCTDIID